MRDYPNIGPLDYSPKKDGNDSFRLAAVHRRIEAMGRWRFQRVLEKYQKADIGTVEAERSSAIFINKLYKIAFGPSEAKSTRLLKSLFTSKPELIALRRTATDRLLRAIAEGAAGRAARLDRKGAEIGSGGIPNHNRESRSYRP